jgi:hypothetical protein
MKKTRIVGLSMGLLSLMAMAWFSIYGPTVFGKPAGTYVSPKGFYRLEYVIPGPPYMFSLSKQSPRFIRLYDNRTGKLLSQSDIIDTNGGNGRIRWPSKEVPAILVGMDVEFAAAPEQ